MLKAFANYLVSLGENKTYEINGHTYSDHPLELVEELRPKPKEIGLKSLDALAKIIRQEIGKLPRPIFVNVVDAKTVSAFSTFDEKDCFRTYAYKAVCDVPTFHEGFRPLEQAVIELRSRFVPGEGVDYLLDLISRVNKENGVTTTDNGVSQTVEARSGVSLKMMVTIKPRVMLTPYRTFLEVEQPTSEFLLRLNDDGEVGLFEADGGIWTLTAKDRIAAYFEAELADLIESGCVVVLR